MVNNKSLYLQFVEEQLRIRKRKRLASMALIIVGAILLFVATFLFE